MDNLYNQLLPNIKFKLKKNKVKYKNSVDYIIAKLHVYTRYNEMTIDDVKILITFGESDVHKWTTYDWKWGYKLFKDEEKS
jgi:spore coat polysaccharide biosynthesis predicted glycosyltransferase SpsG